MRGISIVPFAVLAFLGCRLIDATYSPSCGEFPIIENGFENSTGMEEDHYAFDCNEGYTVRGSKDIECLETQWKVNGYCESVANQSNCQSLQYPCGRIPEIEHGFTLEDIGEFVCLNGYQLRGSREIKCMPGGHWLVGGYCEANNHLPTCGRIPRIENGILIGASNVEQGANGTIICQQGFEIRGSDAVRCIQGGQWQVNGFCQLNESSLPTFPPGKSLPSPSGPSPPESDHPETTTMCPDDNHLEVEEDGDLYKIDYLTPCPDLRALNLESTVKIRCSGYKHGQTCTLSCHIGYKPRTEKIRCLNIAGKPEWYPEAVCDQDLSNTCELYPVIIVPLPSKPEVTLYTVRMNTSKPLAQWSMYYHDEKNGEGSCKTLRSNNFQEYTCNGAPISYHDRHYKKSGFDRGHLTPFRAFKQTIEAAKQTNYHINVVPQDPYTNQKPWNTGLEYTLNKVLDEHGGGYVITGSCPNSVSNETLPHVPDCIWKIICLKDNKGNGGTTAAYFYYNNTILSNAPLLQLTPEQKLEREARINMVRTPRPLEDLSSLLKPATYNLIWEDAEKYLQRPSSGKYANGPMPDECKSVSNLPFSSLDELLTKHSKRPKRSINSVNDRITEIWASIAAAQEFDDLLKGLSLTDSQVSAELLTTGSGSGDNWGDETTTEASTISAISSTQIPQTCVVASDAQEAEFLLACKNGESSRVQEILEPACSLRQLISTRFSTTKHGFRGFREIDLDYTCLNLAAHYEYCQVGTVVLAKAKELQKQQGPLSGRFSIVELLKTYTFYGFTVYASSILRSTKCAHLWDEVVEPAVFGSPAEDELHETTTMFWKLVVNQVLPSDTVISGYDYESSTQVGVCRATVDGQVFPGKVHMKTGDGCFVAYGGEEHQVTTYEVLTGDGYIWVPNQNGEVPQNSIVAAHFRIDPNQPIYVARTTDHRSSIIFGWSQVEVHADQYDVLVQAK